MVQATSQSPAASAGHAPHQNMTSRKGSHCTVSQSTLTQLAGLTLGRPAVIWRAGSEQPGVQPSPAAQRQARAHRLVWPCPLQHCKTPGWPPFTATSATRPACLTQQADDHKGQQREDGHPDGRLSHHVQAPAGSRKRKPVSGSNRPRQSIAAQHWNRAVASRGRTGAACRPQAAPVVEVGEGGVEAYEERPAMCKSGKCGGEHETAH